MKTLSDKIVAWIVIIFLGVLYLVLYMLYHGQLAGLFDYIISFGRPIR